MLKPYSWKGMTIEDFDTNTFSFVFKDGTHQPVYSRLLHSPIDHKVFAMNTFPIPPKLKQATIELVLKQKISSPTFSFPETESNIANVL